jgi:hypothetical protein
MTATMTAPTSKILIDRAESARLDALHFAGSDSPEAETTMRTYTRACKRAGLDPETWEGVAVDRARTEAAAQARIDARNADYQRRIDEQEAKHRAYIDSLTEAEGGEQKTTETAQERHEREWAGIGRN